MTTPAGNIGIKYLVEVIENISYTEKTFHTYTSLTHS